MNVKFILYIHECQVHDKSVVSCLLVHELWLIHCLIEWAGHQSNGPHLNLPHQLSMQTVLISSPPSITPIICMLTH